MILAIPVVISSMPAAANTAIMANQYDSNITLASQCVFFTTLFSVISIPFISILLLSWFIFMYYIITYSINYKYKHFIVVYWWNFFPRYLSIISICIIE